MDLKSFKGLAKGFDEGVEIEIKHPSTHKGTGLFVTVASYQSETVKKTQRKLSNMALKDAKRNPRKAATAEEIEGKTNEVVASAFLSWRGFEDGGKELDCTMENILAVLENPDLWFIGEQVDRVADDQTAFIKA